MSFFFKASLKNGQLRLEHLRQALCVLVLWYVVKLSLERCKICHPHWLMCLELRHAAIYTANCSSVFLYCGTGSLKEHNSSLTALAAGCAVPWICMNSWNHPTDGTKLWTSHETQHCENVRAEILCLTQVSQTDSRFPLVIFSAVFWRGLFPMLAGSKYIIVMTLIW